EKKGGKAEYKVEEDPDTVEKRARAEYKVEED
ncbi:hypothetical protein A2U01_0043912, partial [Trifolium medium]|nr:hypothetical protein [Trifolium medium]